MARLPAATRESVPEGQKEAFDEMVQQRWSIPTTGPGSVMMNAPEVAQRALGLALYLRTDTSLSPRIRELGMLVAARENDCQFIWHAHAPAGRQAGLKDEVVDALRDKKEIPEMAPDEVLVFKVFDSDKTKGVPFTAHTAFDHPDTPADARPRESVESRALVFF